MKRIYFILVALVAFTIFTLVPTFKVNAAAVCCRGRCLPAGGWVAWFPSNNCNFEIHDWCGGGGHTIQTAPASPCPPGPPPF